MTRGRWIFDRKTGKLVSADEFYRRKYADVTYSDLAAPMVVKDTEPYRSVIDGSMIGGRRQHREHLKAHGCVELGNEMPRPAKRSIVPGEIAADIKRSMEDDNLRAEALAATKRAKEAVRS